MLFPMCLWGSARLLAAFQGPSSLIGSPNVYFMVKQPTTGLTCNLRGSARGPKLLRLYIPREPDGMGMEVLLTYQPRRADGLKSVECSTPRVALVIEVSKSPALIACCHMIDAGPQCQYVTDLSVPSSMSFMSERLWMVVGSKRNMLLLDPFRAFATLIVFK